MAMLTISVSVFIYSSLNHMVNFYSFSIDKGDDGADARQPQSSHGYFYLSGNEDETFNRWDKSPRTILLMPNMLEQNPNSSMLSNSSIHSNFLYFISTFFQFSNMKYPF